MIGSIMAGNSLGLGRRKKQSEMLRPAAAVTFYPAVRIGYFVQFCRGLHDLPIVRSFLDEQFCGKALQFGDLRAADIHRFIVRRAQAASRGRAKLVVTTLRFVSATQQRGLLATDLAAAILSHRLAPGAPAESAARRTGRTVTGILR